MIQTNSLNSREVSDTPRVSLLGHPVSAVLFDLDGVLVDSETEYTRIWSTIQREFVHSMPDIACEDFARRIKGTTLGNILDTYFPDPDVQQRVRSRLYEEEDRMTYRYTEGARELLVSLRERGVPAALFTSSNQDKMTHLYRDIPEIRDFFATMVLADDVRRSKPDPEGYLRASELIGVNPEQCCVIEDSLQGVRAGRNAGAYVIGVAGTLSEETLAPEAHSVINSLLSLLPI